MRIIELVYKKEGSAHRYTNLRQFFASDEKKYPDADIQQKQDELLGELITARSQDMNFIEFLFEVIVHFSQERRSRLIFAFLQLNKNFTDFQRLDLRSGPMFWSGSAVPAYQEKIDALK